MANQGLASLGKFPVYEPGLRTHSHLCTCTVSSRPLHMIPRSDKSANLRMRETRAVKTPRRGGAAERQAGILYLY